MTGWLSRRVGDALSRLAHTLAPKGEGPWEGEQTVYGRPPGGPAGLESTGLGLTADGNLPEWTPPRVHPPRATMTIFDKLSLGPLGETEVHHTLASKSAALDRIMATLDAERGELGAAGPVEVGSMTVRLRVELERANAAIRHELWWIVVDMALMALGASPHRPRALERSTLRRCSVCRCVLDNPADWPASCSRGGGCLWCLAVQFDDHDAAAALWGRRMAELCGEELYRGRVTVPFPPEGVYRRPVTAPTLRAYRTDDGRPL